MCSSLASALGEVSDDSFASKRASDADVVRTGLLRDITFLSPTAFIDDLRGAVGFITEAEVVEWQEVGRGWKGGSGGWRRTADIGVFNMADLY